MKKLLFASACAMAILSTGAMAENAGKRHRTTEGQTSGYAYCLKTSIGPGDCKYNTMQQCLASASGISADCVRNYGPR